METKRSNSAIELIRLLMLFLLICTHWNVYWNYSNYIDTSIIKAISGFSVTVFAMITGSFVFFQRSLFWKNVSRIVFIIIASTILSVIIYQLTLNDPVQGLIIGAQGGQYSWYLFSILIVYAIFPLLKNWINLRKAIIITILIFAIYFACWFTIGDFFIRHMSIITSFFSPRTIALVGDAMLGYVIFQMVNLYKHKKHLLGVIFGSLLIFSTIFLSFWGVCTYANINEWTNKWQKVFIIIGASGIIGLCHTFPFYSSRINYISRNSYFIYEFHGLWQLIWVTIFPNYVFGNLHIDLYLNWISIYLFGTMFSFALTFVQKRVWDKYVTIPIQTQINNYFDNRRLSV